MPTLVLLRQLPIRWAGMARLLQRPVPPSPTNRLLSWALALGYQQRLISAIPPPTLPRCAPAPCASAATGRSSVVPNQLAPSSAWPRSSSRLLVAPSPTMTAPMTAVGPLVFYRPCAAAAKALLANRSRAKPTARAVSQFRMHDIPAPLYALLSAGIGLA